MFWIVALRDGTPHHLRGRLAFGDVSSPYDRREIAERLMAYLWVRHPELRGHLALGRATSSVCRREDIIVVSTTPPESKLVAAERVPASHWESVRFTRDFIYGV